jgi:hypothetical protein
MKILRISCVFGGFLSLVLSLSAQAFTTLQSSDGHHQLSDKRTSDDLDVGLGGESIASKGGVAVGEGETSIINPYDPNGSPFVEVGTTGAVELTASDGVAGNTFGLTVAVSGNTVVVGEDCAEITGNRNCKKRRQSVYVYQKSKSGWGQIAELKPSDGSVGDQFGVALAISGNTIVAGALNGKTYVFVKPDGGWKDMTETAQLTDPDTGNGGGISSESIDNRTIVVGVLTATVNGNKYQGAAYVFVEPPTGWATTSVPNGELTASDGSYFDLFGISVAVSGETITVGAPFHHDQTGPGEVYLFEKPPTGWANATQTATLTRSNAGPYDEFGLTVAINGNTVVVGAPQAVGENNGQGVVDVFVKPSKGWSDRTENAELVAPIFIQHFGWSVAIEGVKVTVGTFSPNNVVFAYAKPSKGGWKSTSQPQTELMAGNGVGFFGFSVAMTDSIIVAGAPYETVNGEPDQGAAYLFNE